LVKVAPKLPLGVVWHDGLVIEDEAGGLVVENVVLKMNGDVRVELSDMKFGGEWSNAEMLEWVKDGWTPERIREVALV